MDQITQDQPIKPPGPAIGIFAGAMHGTSPRFSQAARAIGSGIAAMGCSIVFGGGALGLMGEMAQAAMAGGAQVQSVMPAFLHAREPNISPQEKLIVTPHIQKRKTLMLQMSDAFVVLPGGLGTLDEFFEVVTEAQLGVHTKPIIVVNVESYFDALDALLQNVIEKNFAHTEIRTLYRLVNDADAALDLLADALAMQKS
jgi:uncharacterized protein (TIGR00730 family)